MILATVAVRELLVLGGCVAAALVGTAVGLSLWRRRWLIADTPTSKCVNVFAGRNEVIGRAGSAAPRYGPVSGRPCAWLRWEVEERCRDGAGHGTRWRTVEQGSGRAPFLVVDDTGSMVVDPEGAQVITRQRDRRSLGAGDLASMRAELRRATSAMDLPPVPEPSVAKAAFGPASIGSLGDGTSRYRVTEWRIEPDDDLYVMGDAAPSEQGTLRFCAGRGRSPLLIVRGTEAAVAEGARSGAALCLLVGLVGAMGIPAAFHAFRTARPDGPVPGSPGLAEAAQGAMLVAAGVFFTVLGLVWLIRVFNRLVVVKEQAASAWAMIDVSLRRRHDLIPALVEVTSRYAAHEQQTLQTAAQPRSGPMLADPEELPSDETLAEASELDRDEHEAGRSLLTLAERYPELDADQQFRRLRTELVATEDKVAYSRAFYNDALNVLRDRRQAFPGLLLAWAVNVPSWEPFSAERGRRPAEGSQSSFSA